ncbi:unnamed protein product [Allacma fusca]|uniref:Aldehyde oxidase/xanthine dehydrogenase second molybdopterin binding domain-containing protein n=1 Tax=Allacma fusca TaxID=39272 RepID=A0A8J2LCD3_9HEXA|nr:unnamed protein product [Allacma fusca]
MIPRMLEELKVTADIEDRQKFIDKYRIIRVDLMSDAGMSLSPDVDIGQVEGSFVMGLGWLLSEKIILDENTGELLTDRTWNYKPPTAKDLPEDFRVSLLKNAPNSLGVLRSKSLAEAPFVLSLSVFAAMRKAIFAARMDAGNNDWFQMDGPLTPEDIQRYCLTNFPQFSLYLSKTSVYQNFTLEDTIHHVKEVDSWKAPKELQRKFPYYLSGYDYKDQPVWIGEIGKYNVKEQIQKGPEAARNLTLYLFQGIHRIYRSMWDKDAPGKEIRTAFFIGDCEGLDLNQATHIPTVSYHSMSTTSQP